MYYIVSAIDFSLSFLHKKIAWNQIEAFPMKLLAYIWIKSCTYNSLQYCKNWFPRIFRWKFRPFSHLIWKYLIHEDCWGLNSNCSWAWRKMALAANLRSCSCTCNYFARLENWVKTWSFYSWRDTFHGLKLFNFNSFGWDHKLMVFKKSFYAWLTTFFIFHTFYVQSKYYSAQPRARKYILLN